MAYNAGASSGNLVLIKNGIASNSSSNLVLSTSLPVYDVYKLEFYNASSATANDNILLQVSTNGGSSYASSTYQISGYNSDSAQLNNQYSTYAGLLVAPATNTDSSDVPMCGFCYIYNLNNSSVYKTAITNWSGYLGFSLGYSSGQCGSTWETATVVNALQVTTTNGNLTGTFKLYGVQN